MSIFGKKPKAGSSLSARNLSGLEPPPRPRRRARIEPGYSFLGRSCVLQGELRGKGAFECRGTLTGTVDVDGEIIIGEGGSVTAQLSARRIVIHGRLEGDAIGGEKVEVGATGHVEGDVRAPAVLFAEGAFFEGNVEMRRAQPEGEASVAAEVPKPQQKPS
ncbi:MAG: polymer-forming cytoskeletal protein [Acidobacteriota bacterium]